MKLVKIINAASAIIKMADSDDLPASYVWDILDFVEDVRKELNKFETLRKKIVEDNTFEQDGEQVIKVDTYNKALNELFDKEVDIDCSVLDLEQIKKIEGMTPREALSIKELLQD